MTLVFESTTCSRCGGSGQFSYCERYGSVCFKCQGAKETLTKRGFAAQAYLNDLRKVRAGAIVVGQYMQVETMTHRYFAEVITVEPAHCYGDVDTNKSHVHLTTNHPKHGKSGRITARDNMIRVAFTKEEKKVQKETALAYQETLTKAGTVRKRA